MNEHKFKLVLGDWSHDGFGDTEDVYVSADAPVEEIREAYFKGCEVLGFKLEEIGEYIVPNHQKRLLNVGYTFPEMEEGYDRLTVDSFCALFKFFIHLGGHEVSFYEPPELPEFHFYGYDEKGRHIGAFGLDVVLGW